MRRLLITAEAVLLTAALAACGAPLGGSGAGPGVGTSQGTGLSGAQGTGLPKVADSGSPSAVPGGPGTSLLARLGEGARGASAAVLAKVAERRVTFSLSWSGMDAPSAARIERTEGGTGTAVLLFGSPLPGSARAAAGQLTLDDPALAEDLRGRPADFTVTLTAAGAPGGTLSGPVTVSDTPVDPLGVIPGGTLSALADGRQEADLGTAGDPDAVTNVSLDPDGTALDYSLAWVNLRPPTRAQVQRGELGQDGEVAVPLFTSPLPGTIIALSGTAPVADPATLRQLAAEPGGFYVSLHTDDFPEGAVRGQVFR
ncbi:CHRD domain-containing protein [Streptomyces sp. NPDC004610]|uniref:CHRD domain-containing protein n=1 Tax=unclassified Streptomyces TaxID=2593676 RepID=UPI0033A9BB8D